jgi:hypothetical protein
MSTLIEPTAEQLALDAELGLGPAETARCLLLATMPRAEIDAVTALQLGPDCLARRSRHRGRS